MSSTTRLLRSVKQTQINWRETEDRTQLAREVHFNWETCGPSPIARIKQSRANACCCNPQLILGPLLTFVASLLHFETKIQLRAEWSEPPVLWIQVINITNQHTLIHKLGPLNYL